MDPDEFIPTRQTLLSRLKDWEDQSSWRDFFDTYWRLIYGVARKAGLPDAEAQDVVQETLLAVAKKMPGFTYDPAVDSFKGWLLRVTQWKVADQFRKQSGVKRQSLLTSTLRSAATEDGSAATREEGPGPTSIDRVADPASSDLQAIWDEEWQTHLLHTALDRVKRRVQPGHYELYYLHVIKEQAVGEVARTLGVSAATIYLAKHRVGRLLKKEVRSLETKRTFGIDGTSHRDDRE